MGNPNMHLDWDTLTDRYMAARAVGDRPAMREVTKQIKLSPCMARAALQNMGKEAFLNMGFDLSCVEAEYGKDWLDRYEH